MRLPIGRTLALACAVAAVAALPAYAATSKASKDITLVWGGDTTLGSSYGDPPDHGRALFTGVRSILQNADLTAVNLEGTLGTGGTPKCASGPACFVFQGPPANAAALRWAGVDIVNLANNHAFDFGATGMGQTIHALAGNDIAYTGRPGEIRVLEAGGKRIAFLGFSSYKWTSPLLDLQVASEFVREAHKKADIVVVFIHAGAEGADQVHVPYTEEHAYGEDRGNSRAFAHAVIDAGADLVVGSGPHVLRGMEVYKGHLIAYSLGNLAGWHNFGRGGNLSLTGLLRVRLTPNGAFDGGRLYPLAIGPNGTSSPDPSHAAVNLVRTVSKEDFGARAVHIGPSGTLHVSASR